MLTFLHPYAPGYWHQFLKSGLWRDGDAVRLPHKPIFGEKNGFNHIAAPGTPLYRFIEETRCPFYVDRLLGGIELPRWYDFDQQLVEQYKALLGDRFWGFQMHEWASNYQHDCDRIDTAIADYLKRKPASPASGFWQAIEEQKETCFCEAYTPAEWATRVRPKTLAGHMQELETLYARRLAQTGGPLVPADSYAMAPRLELRHGAQRLLPEVGWQIPDMRVQMAYTRGMAKSAAIPWGIYYECWKVDAQGLSLPYANRDLADDWDEDYGTPLIRKGCSWQELENGGSSRSLQERAWLYAYLCGATMLGEEYGICTTFRDFASLELSEYGIRKQNFIRFTQKYPDIGRPFTPVAVVLPRELELYEVASPSPDTYLGFPLFSARGDGFYGRETLSESFSKKIKAIRAGMAAIFGTTREMCGNETHVIKNGGFPDVFDILHADQAVALAKYDYLVDLTGDEHFAQTHQNIVSLDQLARLLETILPVKVQGSAHWLLNQTDDGWLLLVMNNSGIERSREHGDRKLPEAALPVRIRWPDGTFSPRVLEGSAATLQREGNYFNLCLNAGEWIIFAF